ncbi:MAG TPA: hypothetical protein VEO54_04270 [Thermoanaerobaculia bacterium]|nr:hypothetical protein [Thermoanaerobaculia bacterium]
MAVSLRQRNAAFAVLFAAVFLAVHWPLYVEPGVRLGWNSDASLYGLMAREMVATRQPLFLFWGGDYLGTLTSMWAVLASLFAGEVGPLALRLGNALQFVIALLLFGDGLRRVYGWGAGAFAILWLAAGPSFFFKLTYAPVSAEQMFFVGAVVFWLAVRKPLTGAVSWLVLGILCGLGFWAHRGALFVVLPAVAIGLWYDRARPLMAGACGLAGTAIGLLPQFLGRMEIDQRLYTPLAGPWSLRRVVEQLTMKDLVGFLGAGHWSVAVLAVALAAYALRGMPRTRGHALALGVVITVFGFWTLSGLAYPGALRYLILALPIVYAWIAAGILRFRRLGFVALLVAVALCAVRHRDAREIAAGHREQHEHWPGGFDPRPVLAVLDRERYPVCYADFWLAYKLEWLSTSGVQFIPYRSVNSTQVRSLRLAAAPGEKCFVTLQGEVRRLSGSEQAELRADTIALVRGRPAVPR